MITAPIVPTKTIDVNTTIVLHLPLPRRPSSTAGAGGGRGIVPGLKGRGSPLKLGTNVGSRTIEVLLFCDVIGTLQIGQSLFCCITRSKHSTHKLA